MTLKLKRCRWCGKLTVREHREKGCEPALVVQRLADRGLDPVTNDVADLLESFSIEVERAPIQNGWHIGDNVRSTWVQANPRDSRQPWAPEWAAKIVRYYLDVHGTASSSDLHLVVRLAERDLEYRSALAAVVAVKAKIPKALLDRARQMENVP